MKKQEKQKQKIKVVLLKILHIVSYVLSLAFIGLCILTGVQSCSKPKAQANKVSRETIVNRVDDSAYDFDYEGFFYLKYKNGDTMDWSDQLDIANYCEVDIENTYPMINLPDVQKTIIAPVDTLYGYVNDEVVNFTYFFVNFRGYPISDGAVRGIYRIRTIQAWVGGSAHDICRKVNSNDYDLVYNYGDDVSRLFLRNDNYSNVILNRLYIYYDANEVVDFTFNYQFNYNAPIGAMFDNSIYYIDDFNTTDYLPYVVKKIECYFVVNGYLYNEMWFTYYRANDNIYYYDDFGRITLWEGTTYDTHGYFHDLKFVNTYTNKQVEVYRRRIYSQYEQGYSLIDNGGYWVSNYYQHIHLLEINDSLNLTLSKLNNTERATTGVSGGNYGDMFGLLTSAFTSLLPILNISIIPGITLGLLLFIPLIVILISVVVRLVKK